jgi:hypothetical protein
MKNAKQRFNNQRLATFTANLDEKLWVNGKFHGTKIFENVVSSVETMEPSESWSLGKTNDGHWVVWHHEIDCLTAWTVSSGRSFKSKEATIPLPADLRARFARAINRKSIASLLEKVRLDIPAGAGKTSAALSVLDLFISHQYKVKPCVWYLDSSMLGPRVFTVWRP